MAAKDKTWYSNFASGCPLYAAFKPFFYYGKFIGQFYLSIGDSNNTLVFIYCILLCAVLVAATVRFAFAFDSTLAVDAPTMTKVLTFTYHMGAALSHLCVLRVQNKLAPVFHHLVQTVQSENEMPSYASKLKKFTVSMIVVCISFSVANGVLIPLINLDVIPMPFKPTVVNGIRSLIWIDGLLAFLVQNGLLYCTGFYASLCFLVYLNFQQLYDRMSKDRGRPVWEFVCHFQELISCTRTIEKYFGLYCFMAFAIIVPMLCTTMYVLLKTKTCTVETMAVLVFWLVDTVLMLLFVAVPAILINDQGDRLLHVACKLYRDRAPNLDVTEKEEMRFLVQQVHATDIGINANGFFMITRGLMITLFSAVATYLIIILQFDSA